MARVLWLITALVLVFAATAGAVEVQQTLWGFDGRVRLGSFNPLSVYVYNGGEKPFDGALVLRKDSGAGPLGARLIEPCYLSPGTGRWITFYPFITSSGQSWALSWGRRREQRTELDPPDIGERAAVFLWTDRISRPPSALPAFEAGRFPTTVGATDGLGAVLIDSTPDWDPLRRKAFIDWVWSGGRVHLLKPPAGELQFAGELVELNNPSEEFRVGAGRVVRHEFGRGDLDPARLEAMGLGQPKRDGSERDARPGRGPYAGQWAQSSTEQSAFAALQSVIRPEHKWWLIYFASIVFLLLVGPANGLLSRRRWNYRGSLAFVALAVAAFSYGFYTVGQRGYGEKTSVHKIAYARALSDGFDVLQYANAFVTRGDQYRIGHDGRHNLYSTAQNYEPVRGLINFSGGGSFDVDIPIYSWRSFVHRGFYPAQPFAVTVERWPQGPGPEELVVKFGQASPASPAAVWALRGELMSNMLVENATAEARGGGVHYRDMLGLAQQRQNARYYRSPYGYYGNQSDHPKPTLIQVLQPLVSHAIIADRLGVLHADSDRPLTEPDHIMLFILAPAPPEFSARMQGLEADHGYVIYQLDLFAPAAQGENVP